jgi:hypothetical protein
MREQILQYLRTLTLQGFKVSNDLPYTSSGEELYIKNVKSIYVGQLNTATEPFVVVMNSNHVESEVSTVNVTFATDAKTPPSNYNTVVEAIKTTRDLFMSTHFRRECDVTVDLVADLQITQLEFRFTRLT